MKTRMVFTCAGLGLALALAVAMARQGTAADDESANVRKQCAAFVKAWNAHDPKGMAAVFAPDGDSIDPLGHHAAGKEAVEKAFAADHGEKGPLRESTIEVIDEPIRFMTPEVAVSDAEVTMRGAFGPDGTQGEPTGVHVTNVWKKTGGIWFIFASRPYIKLPAGK